MKSKVKVRVIRAFICKQTNETHKCGEEPVLREERARQLMERGFVEILREDKTGELEAEIAKLTNDNAELVALVKKLEAEIAKLTKKGD